MWHQKIFRYQIQKEIFNSLTIDFDNILPQANEFILNIITPLNLDADVIEDFNKYVLEVSDNIRQFREHMDGDF